MWWIDQIVSDIAWIRASIYAIISSHKQVIWRSQKSVPSRSSEAVCFLPKDKISSVYLVDLGAKSWPRTGHYWIYCTNLIQQENILCSNHILHHLHRVYWRLHIWNIIHSSWICYKGITARSQDWYVNVTPNEGMESDFRLRNPKGVMQSHANWTPTQIDQNHTSNDWNPDHWLQYLGTWVKSHIKLPESPTTWPESWT